MSWTIIVASSDGDQQLELVNSALEIKERIGASFEPPIHTAASVEAVKKCRTAAGNGRHLLIVTATLPCLESSPDREAEPGLAFVQSLANEPNPPACILITEQVEHYRAVKNLNRCELIVVDSSTNYVEECLAMARKLAMLEAVPVVPSPPIGGCAVAATGNGSARAEHGNGAGPKPDSAAVDFVSIEVDLHEGRSAMARLDIGRGGKTKRGESRTLDLRPRVLDDLLARSQAIRGRFSKALASGAAWEEYHSEWPTEYQTIGEGFAKLLWRTRFQRLYFKGFGLSRGNVRVRFNLEGKWLDGLWEAMLDDEYKRPLMIEKTVTRRARPPEDDDDADDDNAIPADDGVLNILVIKSDVPDDCSPVGPGDLFWQKFWTGFNGTLLSLPDLSEEVAVLDKLKGRTASNGVVVNVTLLECPPGAPAEWSLANKVKQALKPGGVRYDIVHFAGHALFASNANGKDRRGYLIFSRPNGADAIAVATVATWLENAGVQLVYLSCCRSSAACVELEFARNNVPMTIGFNWDLEDSKAVDFAKNFYDALLENGLKVCVAMRLARRELFNTYDIGNPIWASPVLLAQPMDWGQVEAVLRPALHGGSTPAPPPPSSITLPAFTARNGGPMPGLTTVPTPIALQG